MEEKPLGVARLPATKGLILLDTVLLACSSPRGADSATLNFIPLYPSIAVTLGKQLGILENN